MNSIPSFTLGFGLALMLAGSFTRADEDALVQAQKLLQDASQRVEVLQKDTQALAVDRQVDAVVGADPAKKEKLYQISSQALGDLEKQKRGDPEAMAKALEQAQKDPEGFFKTLSPENQAAIRAMARDLEARKKGTEQP